MSKIVKILWLLFFVEYFLLQPVVVNAVTIPGTNTTPPCIDQQILVTLDAPKSELKDIDALTLGLGQPFGVNVKIPDATAQNNWKYYIVILSHPDLSTERLTTYGSVNNPGSFTPDRRIKGDTPTTTETIKGVNYRVYHWDFTEGELQRPLFRTDFNEFAVELKHAEEVLGFPTHGADVCLGPQKQIRTISSTLSQVDSCPLTISDNFNSADPVTGTVTLKKVDGIMYGYRINNEGDVTSQVPKDPLNPKPLSQIPGYNPLKPFIVQVQFDDILSPGTNVKLPEKRGLDNGIHTATIYAATQMGTEYYVFACGTSIFKVSNDPTSSPISKGGTNVVPATGTEGNAKICVANDPNCTSGVGTKCGDINNPGIGTAIGCIHTSPIEFVKDLFKFLVVIGGGVAFLMMLLGAFQMLTSAGNPETLQAGRDRFTSAIIGLLIVIFAVLLLQIIGVGILAIPGFSVK